jgi:hypothetical protein
MEKNAKKMKNFYFLADSSQTAYIVHNTRIYKVFAIIWDFLKTVLESVLLCIAKWIFCLQNYPLLYKMRRQKVTYLTDGGGLCLINNLVLDIN